MTEIEAIENHKRALEIYKKNYERNEVLIDFYKTSINALEEIQKYHEIGTVEELRNAMEKQTPKIPNVYGDGYDENGNIIYDTYECPNCGKCYEIDYDDYKYCPECGQAILKCWEEE